MGTGICGAILLEFGISSMDKKDFEKDTTNDFLNYYDIQPESKKADYEFYKIKDNILLSNYADFLKEFYTLIEDEFKGINPRYYNEPYDDKYTEELLSIKTRKEFNDAFKKDQRNGSTPYIDDYPGLFSCIYCEHNIPFIFYSGSYKAYLEEYSTLLHMEKMLAKAMTNPLKTVVKFGIYG